ncbi:restin homolog [Sabethes cyaneus]|uniref:restin homolog n=1 Tax=Sabethes cyaneus TaxID=53552 RepID=UPI00237E980C|nr:restin homolog [Sabethes cyaneus]
MFNFFKRSKSQKSKQKLQLQPSHGHGDASQQAVPGACVANTLETQRPVVVRSSTVQHVQGGDVASRCKVDRTGAPNGSGEEGGSIKNKQHSSPTAVASSGFISPSDIIHENGCSFGLQDGDNAIEFVDGEEEVDETVIDECVQPRREHFLPLEARGERNDSTFERSTSYNQSANLIECDMAKGRNKRRYQQQQQQQQQQQGGKNSNQQQQGQKQSGQKQTTNKESNLLLKKTEESSGKFDKVDGGKLFVIRPENVNPTPSSKDNKIIPNEARTKVTTAGEDATSKQRPCLMVGDVNGENVADREDKNSIVLCSDTNKPSSDSRVDGANILTGKPTATAPPTATSQLPLTQTTNPSPPVGVCNGAGSVVSELLSCINSSSSVSSQCPVGEDLRSSSGTGAAGIKDDLRQSPTSSELVTSKDVTSNKEMGQQPSKTSDSANRSSRRSITPTQHHQPTAVLSQLVLPPKNDVFRDDSSDDRDVFYETTESVSTPSPITTSVDDKTSSPFDSVAVPKDFTGESKINPKKRVVFSDQLVVDGNPSPERDSRKVFASENALNLDPLIYEPVAKNNDEHMHAASSPPGSLVNNNLINGVNVVLSVGSEQHAFNSDRSGISVSVPATIIAKAKLIDFKYDNSEPINGGSHNGFHKEEKEAPEAQFTLIEPDSKEATPVIMENGISAELIVEDLISLPDVVQPTSIEKTAKQPFNTVDKINSEMKELVNQESRYSAKLEDAEKRSSEAQTKVYELQLQLDEAQREISLKECNVERLQAELDAACRECESIQVRLRTQNANMDALRLKFSDKEDELNLKYQNLEIELLEVNEKLKEVRQLAHDLNRQLLDAKADAEKLQQERNKLLEERAEEQKIIKEALEAALKERHQVDAKWKNDFERLRTVHSDREEHLMEDCEWKIRSMQKHCKEKLESAERERKVALDNAVKLEQESRKHLQEAKHLRSYETEVAQLRGLTYDQQQALTAMTRQLDHLKSELEVANNKLEAEIVKVQQIKSRCEYQLCEKEREALNRIEIARGEIAMQWEDRLLHEMNRLKIELEQMHIEERLSAIEKIKREALQETEALSHKFNMREKQLKEEIDTLKAKLIRQKQAMEDAQTEADARLVQSRMFVERAEREHEAVLAREVGKRDEIIENLKEQYEREKQEMEQHFSLRIQQVQEEFARELSDTTELLKISHKRELEKQWKQLVSDKEEALQQMESRHRTRMDEAENKIRELKVGHQRQLKDLQEEHRFEVNSLETRDMKNAQEIQTLHKKCRCLTNLFEEMRMRYERREPRREDLQQIEELKSVIESQDRDLRLLTERLREMQLQEEEFHQLQKRFQQLNPPQPPRRAKNHRGGKQYNQTNQSDIPAAVLEHDQELQKEVMQQQQPQPVPQITTSVPIVCDVIYEENEADLIKEEEEEDEVEEETANDGEVENEGEELIVVLPESAILTETTEIQSTEPMIIETPPNSPSVVLEENNQSEAAEEQNSDPVGQPEVVVVIESDQLPEPEKPIPLTTPTIVITADPTAEADDSDDVSICTVVELQSQLEQDQDQNQEEVTKPSDSAPSSSAEDDQFRQKIPEMIVIRVPDVVVEAAAVAAAAAGVAGSGVSTDFSDSVVVSSPGPRSSST